jgi:hypothetical protein
MLSEEWIFIDAFQFNIENSGVAAGEINTLKPSKIFEI